MALRLAVEQDDAPVAVDRVEAVADAVENGVQPGFGEKRGDLSAMRDLGSGVGNWASPMGGGTHRYRHPDVCANFALRG